MVVLTIPVPCISKSSIEIKIKLNFYFHTSLRCLKVFIKPFEVAQSVKIKISVNFFRSSGIGTERIKLVRYHRSIKHFDLSLSAEGERQFVCEKT